MTDDARAKAVEAAAIALCDAQLGVGVWASLWENQRSKWRANADLQITTYERTMAEAGWVMVPREPSLEMLQAGYDAGRVARHSGVSGQTIDASMRAKMYREAEIYAAMLAGRADTNNTGD